MNVRSEDGPPLPDDGTRRADRRRGGVIRAVPTVRPGQVLACSMSLLCAGVLLTRGFIGLVPGRPVYVVLGLVLAASALWALSVDHITLRITPDQPTELVAEEMNRSRRFGHPLTVVQVRCDEAAGRQIAVGMRACDRAWRRRGALAVMLVETDGAGARSVVRRIAELVPAGEIRMATFPDDTLTIGQLLDPVRPVSVHDEVERGESAGPDVVGRPSGEVTDGIAEAAS